MKRLMISAILADGGSYTAKAKGPWIEAETVEAAIAIVKALMVRDGFNPDTVTEWFITTEGIVGPPDRIPAT